MFTHANELITKAEAAQMLGGVTVGYVDQLLAKRRLPKVRLSYKVCRIPRQAVADFIASRTIQAREVRQ